MSFTDLFKKIFGTKADRDMKAIRPMLDKVLVAYSSIDKLTDDELREKCQSLKDLIQSRIAGDETRIADIKVELSKEIPLSQKEKLATEADKLVKEVDKKIETATAFIYEMREESESVFARAKTDEVKAASKKVRDAF